jgi:hypothetical protein
MVEMEMEVEVEKVEGVTASLGIDPLHLLL